ncbi:MAG TPA: PDZ domain-containing protein, partial [Clostridiales bacterium]|nr:PDZ domain-containing protein [Clostridiales bacterium]
MLKRLAKKSMIAFLSAAVVFANAAAFSYADSLDADLMKLKNMIRTVRQNYVEEVSEEELMYGAYSGVFQVLDSHSMYYSPEEMKIFENATVGKFGGVGLLVEMREGKLIVVSPIEGTPAEKAGILPGDVILSVNGETLQGASLSDAVEKMQGEPGTKVTLGIEREGKQLTFK